MPRGRDSNSKPSKKLSQRAILFEYYTPHAQKVCLGGTFNQWNPEACFLKKDSSGKWTVTLKLSPGRYEYRYVVDGAWENDQRPVECVPNAFGSWNCVVTVQ